MSLQNPDNIVTEERLAEFYQQILPYMGGMPDVLANKFNRADLYSTDEKMIGRWIDGKPIYQKTVECNTPSSTGSLTIIADVSALNIDTVCGLDGLFKDGTGSTASSIPVSYYINDNNAAACLVLEGQSIAMNILSTTHKNKPAKIVIQYTKTTDSAVEIGSDTDYSTTEKIVGTWIDGKPVYQKTIAITTPNKDTEQHTPIGAEIDTVVDYIAMFKNTQTTTGVNNWIKAGSLASQLASTTTGMVVHINPNDADTSVVPANTISIRHNATGWGGKTVYVTVKYTKVS